MGFNLTNTGGWRERCKIPVWVYTKIMKGAYHHWQNREFHHQGNWLRDVILGGQDGLVNVLGIVLGVAAATQDTRILLAAALSATFAEAVSMGAVAYTSAITERDRYYKEFKREQDEIQNLPEVETEELRQIYADKGFKGELLDQIVGTITANKKVWLNIMMTDELKLQSVETKDVLRSAVIVAAAAVLGSLIPIFPFLVLAKPLAILSSLIVSALSLFIVGVYEAKTYAGDWRKSGIKMVVIGMGAAAVGYLVGRIFQVSP